MELFNVPKQHYSEFSEYLIKAQMSFIKVSEKTEGELIYTVEVFGSDRELDMAHEYLNLLCNY